MIASTGTFIEHVKLLRRAARSVDAELLLAGDTLTALLRRGDRTAVLYPQFLLANEGVIRRTPALHDQSQAFLGFLPYPSRQWPLAIDRLAFKRHVLAAGLLSPAQREPGAPDVVVRRVQPSFEPFVRGPYRNASEHPIETPKDEFYEEHIEGDALTAWFWDGQPLCATVIPLPTVVGDGRAPLGELVVRAASAAGTTSPQEMQFHLSEAGATARYAGLELSSIPAVGARVVVGLGHGSPLLGARPHRLVDLTAAPPPAWAPALRTAGTLLQAAAPEEFRAGTLFTVNATMDRRGAVWLHDLDASPYVHPLCYAPMIASFFTADPALPPEQRRN